MLPIAPKAPQFVPVTPADLRAGLRPVWVRKGAELLESFGAVPPYDDIVAVAAVPVEVLRPGRPFAIYKETGGARSIRIGVIRADDAAAWR